MPSVSVVITTFNRAALLVHTLESVLAQTYKDFEIVVVDDGSSDDTPSVMAGYSAQGVTYIRQANAGQTFARNAGVRAARGEYVAFVDDDDLWLPEKLARQMACAKSLPEPALIYGDTEMFDHASGKTLYRYSRRMTPHSGRVAEKLIRNCFVPSPTPLVPRRVIEEVGFFNESRTVKYGEDWEMWLRIASRYPLQHLPEVLARYRVHAQGMIASADPMIIHRGGLAVIAQAAAFAPDVYGPLRAAAEAWQCVRTGNTYLVQSKGAEARAMYREALRLDPKNAMAYRNWLASLAGAPAIKLWRWLRGMEH